MTKPEPQGYAIQLYFDPTAEKEIFSFRESIYALGLRPVLGKMNDRPHVTFCVISQADPEVLKRLACDFSQKIKPFEFELAAVGVFPTVDNVVFLTPVPTLQLIKTHRDFHLLLKKEKINSSHYYLPGHWVPHCTLEFELPDDQFDLAVQQCKKHFSPIRGQFAAMGVIAFRPIQYLAEYKLHT